MADERKYFVMCENNCKFESMTKEQIFAAITEATGNVPTGIDDAFITKLKDQNNNVAMKIWGGTEAEYNALVARGEFDENTIYCIKKDGAFLLKTPTRGVDYWTEEDTTEIISDAITEAAEAAKAAQTAAENAQKTVDNLNTENWTFTLADGSKVYKTIYIVRQKWTFCIFASYGDTLIGAYDYEIGMTWGEWLDSPYNTEGYWWDSSYQCIRPAGDEWSGIFTSPDYTVVGLSDKITNETKYIIDANM